MTDSAPSPKDSGGGFSLDMTAKEFRTSGHRLVDDIAQLLETLPTRPVTPGVARGARRHGG